jgi:hypothetical protein
MGKPDLAIEGSRRLQRNIGFRDVAENQPRFIRSRNECGAPPIILQSSR